MANRRMLPKSLSVSIPFNSVSEFAELLYAVMHPHFDDFGKQDGNPVVIKALVMPMNKRPVDDFKKAVDELVAVGLLDYYEVDKQAVIKCLTFEEDQTGLNKRTKSKFPDRISNSNSFPEILRTPQPTEQNITEPILTKPNLKEANEPNNIVANNISLVNPKKFQPTNDGELAAIEVWRLLEPDNPFAFGTTYLYAYRKGLPAVVIRRFASEIRQSKCDKPGAVFNTKVKDYLDKMASTIGRQSSKLSS